MKKLLIALAMMVSTVCSAQTTETLTFSNLRAYDGDTVRTPLVVIKGLSSLSIRVKGIDTPEIRGQCDSEKVLAKKARDRLNEMLVGEVTVVPVSWDKYGGRFIASIYMKDGKSVADVLIAENLAYKYNGGQKRSWCK